MKDNASWIVGVVVAVGIGYALFSGSQSSKTQSSSASTQQVATQSDISAPQQTASVANQQQCETDGQTFSRTWFNEIFTSGEGWEWVDEPSYHFSTKLNTCLVEMQAVSLNPSSLEDSTT